MYIEHSEISTEIKYFIMPTKLLLILWCILINIQVSVSQYIAEDENPGCQFLNDSINNKPILKYSTGIEYKFNILGIYQFIMTPCSTSSAAVILRDGKRINAGNTFDYVLNAKGEAILKSVGGEKCKNGKFYSVELSFECTSATELKPKFKGADNDYCEFELIVPSPTCDKIKCVANVYGHMIDLNHLSNQEFSFKKDNSIYYISLCGNAKSCGQQISACEIVNGTIIPIGDLQSHQILYDPNSMQLYVKMTSGTAKQTKKETKVQLQCNFKETFANPTVRGLRKKTFTVQSKVGCLKLPLNCSFKKHDLLYNYSKLYKENGWKAGDVSLNICGKLKTTVAACSSTHAQVCYKSLNYGSIRTENDAVDDSTVNVKFSYGAVCPKDATKLLSTNILLECSNVEKGPAIKSVEDCSLNIIWKTPHVCPNMVIVRHDCRMDDRIGPRDLTEIYSSQDVTIPFKDYVFRYNLCGPLKSSCNNTNKTSACVESKNGEQSIVGYESKDIKSVNGALSMTLEGDMCTKSIRSKVMVNFRCAYNKKPQSNVTVVHDACVFKLDITTSLACRPKRDDMCTVRDGSYIYNLSDLALPNRNYGIIDRKRQLEFSINLCGPVIPTPNSFCLMNTGVCMKNLTEPNIINRFISLGYPMNLQVVRDELHMSFRTDFFSSLIRFQCGSSKGTPQLVSDSGNQYTFLWKTKNACRAHASIKTCVFNKHDKLKTRYYLGEDETENLKITKDEHNYIIMDMCSAYYVVHTNGTENYFKSDFKILEPESNLIFKYTTQQNCVFNSPNIFELNGVCSEKSSIVYRGINNCSFLYDWNSNQFCGNAMHAVPKITATDESTVRNVPFEKPDHTIAFIIVGVVLGVLSVIIFILVGYRKKLYQKYLKYKKANVEIYSRDLLT